MNELLLIQFFDNSIQWPDPHALAIVAVLLTNCTTITLKSACCRTESMVSSCTKRLPEGLPQYNKCLLGMCNNSCTMVEVYTSSLNVLHKIYELWTWLQINCKDMDLHIKPKGTLWSAGNTKVEIIRGFNPWHHNIFACQRPQGSKIFNVPLIIPTYFYMLP